ncbi:hypothetical protein PG997_005642 [Apiospora hydei]|uniref:Uncharacterized protein n=1 Tax=Apiospora hydei TaxID=1337664 RepID=A0ABR1WLF4_9PEZI
MNATTGGFTLIWSVSLLNTCRDEDPLGDPEAWAYHSRQHNVKFTIAEGAPLPDIEAAVNACSSPDSTLAITPHGWRDGVCPVLRSNDTTPSAATPCGLKTVAREIADEVSAAMLGLMGCSEGTWQNIKTPCLPKEKSKGLRMATGWELVLVLALDHPFTMAIASRSARIPDAKWEEHKFTIVQQFVDQNMSLGDIVKSLKTSNFIVT